MSYVFHNVMKSTILRFYTDNSGVKSGSSIGPKPEYIQTCIPKG